VQRRHLEGARADQRRLRLALDPRALDRTRRRRGDAGALGGTRRRLARRGLRRTRRFGGIVERIVVVERRLVEIVGGRGAAGLELGLHPAPHGRRDAPLGGQVEISLPALRRAAQDGPLGGEAAEVAAHEGARRQPPVNQGAERQDALVALVVVVLPGDLRVFLAVRREAAATEQAGAVGEQPEARRREDNADDDRGEAGGIGADQQRRQAQRHVAENAAEAGGKGPGLRRREAAGHAGDEDGPGEPGGQPARHAVHAVRRDQEDAPGDGRDKADHRREAIELHDEVGEDGARITHGIGDGVRRRVAEARIGNVPRTEAGEREGDEGEQADAGETSHLAEREGVQTPLAPRQR